MSRHPPVGPSYGVHNGFIKNFIANRLMSPFERQLVMNLLWLESPLEAKLVTSWVTLEGRR